MVVLYKKEYTVGVRAARKWALDGIAKDIRYSYAVSPHRSALLEYCVRMQQMRYAYNAPALGVVYAYRFCVCTVKCCGYINSCLMLFAHRWDLIAPRIMYNFSI